MSYCNEIEKSNIFFGDDEQKFKSEDGFIYRNACSMCIVQIGELVGQLSNDIKDSHPEVPWKEIKGMRNFFAHEYHQMDPEVMWYTIHKDIPVLKQNCANILILIR